MRAFEQVIRLYLDGQVTRSTAGHPFFTTTRWVNARDLKPGDRVRTSDNTWATIKAVAVEERPVHQLAPGFAPYPSSGQLPAGTLIQTAAGLKPVEDICVGDYVVVPSPERN